MRWAGHVALMGEKRNAYRLLVERDHYENQDVGGWITLRWILVRWDGVVWFGSGEGQVESCCECVNELSGSTKCWETNEWLHNWWPLEQCSVSWS
jgi:hypothetical protein